MTEASAGTRTKPRVAFFVTVDWYFANHYLALACAIRDAGYAVSVITGVDAHGERIREAGLDLIPFRISRKGMHPIAELTSLLRLVGVLRRVRPDLLHNIAQKPVLYGGLAARLIGVPAVVAALPGLGWLFTSVEPRARIGRRLVLFGYRRLLRHPRVRVLVQNEADRDELNTLAGLNATLVPGSGVNLKRFKPGAPPPSPVTIVLASRLLWHKGVGELVEAMKILLARNIACRCWLVGQPDDGNPASVTRQWLEERAEEGVIEWLGYRADMPAVLGGGHVACLPTYYREGIPKFLLEAAAAGLPLIATDVPGCRDVVQPELNGLLVPPRDAFALANALQRLIEDADLRARMGKNARAIAEARFANERIFAEVQDVYADLLGPVD